MTGLLASVRNWDEAILAMDAGVDILDLKNPDEGALGALPLQDIREITHRVDGRVVISATIGDLPMQPERLVFAIEHTARQGVDIVKVGFFGAAGYDACIQAMQPLAISGIRIVAVLFADQAPDLQVLPRMKAAGFYGVMLDTADKRNKSLVEHMARDKLRGFLQSAHDLGLETGLAGSLKSTDIPMLMSLQPGYLGFRGALCGKNLRGEKLLKSRLLEVKELLHENNKSCAYAGRA